MRLDRTATAILVPTERGRLAIAPADEDALLDALSRAARARQRLDELTAASPNPQPGEQEPEQPEAHEPQRVDAVAVEVQPKVLTGIERALLERRMAQEREEAAAALASEAARIAGTAGSSASDDAEAGESRAQAPSPHRRRRLTLRRPPPSAVFILLPLIGAGAVWGLGLLTDSYPEPGTDLGRLTALALVLAGPATSVGAIMARAWWPRLVGLVVAGGLCASAFIARALIG